MLAAGWVAEWLSGVVAKCLGSRVDGGVGGNLICGWEWGGLWNRVGGRTGWLLDRADLVGWGPTFISWKR